MEDEVATGQSFGPFQLLKEGWQVCDPYPVNQGRWGDCQASGQSDQRQVTVDMVYTVDTVYTIQNALHCLTISMYVCLYYIL